MRKIIKILPGSVVDKGLFALTITFYGCCSGGKLKDFLRVTINA